MHFEKTKMLVAAICFGMFFTAPVVLAQTGGSLTCSSGECDYSSPPPGTAHWEWSIYRIGGGAVGSPYNCTDHYLCEFSCAISGTAHITVIATDTSNQVIGSVSDTAHCPIGGV